MLSLFLCFDFFVHCSDETISVRLLHGVTERQSIGVSALLAPLTLACCEAQELFRLTAGRGEGFVLDCGVH